MSYFITVTLDLKDGTSAQYHTVDKILAEIGLEDSLVGSSGKKVQLPKNTYAGEFEGESVGKVRTDITNLIASKFKEEAIDSSIFVAVGKTWAWAIRNT